MNADDLKQAMENLRSGLSTLEEIPDDRPYCDLLIKEGDRVGYAAEDGRIFVGTVISHVEVEPGVWTTTFGPD